MNLHQMLAGTELEVINAFKRRAIDARREVVCSEKPQAFVFFPGNADSRICLVAHVDTVCTHKTPKSKRIIEKYGIITAEDKKGERIILGADDRAGCWCLWELFDHPKRPHILLTNYEEVGGMGAREFSESNLTEMWGIQWFIEFDRKGCNKYVQYNDNPKEMHDYLKQFGIENDGRGSYSDIATISKATKVPSVNLATGYFAQHTEREYLDINAMGLAINKAALLISEFPLEGFGEIDEKPVAVYRPLVEYVYADRQHMKGSDERDQERHFPRERNISMEWCARCSTWEDSCECECIHCGFPKWQCRCKYKSETSNYHGI